MTTPITSQKARQLRLDDYYEYLRTHNPKKYAQHLRQQQELREREQFWRSEEGQAVQAEVEAFFNTPEEQARMAEFWQKYQPQYHAEYELLGIDTKATKRDIKNAYRRQARKLHPDKGGDAEAFKQMHAAYRQLLAITKD